MDRDIHARIPHLCMDIRVLEVLTAIGSLALFIILLMVSTMLQLGGPAYVIALIIFIVALGTAGYWIDKLAA
jgi:hypothetical protein